MFSVFRRTASKMTTEAMDDAKRLKHVPYLFVRGTNYQIGFSIVSFWNKYFQCVRKRPKLTCSNLHCQYGHFFILDGVEVLQNKSFDSQFIYAQKKLRTLNTIVNENDHSFYLFCPLAKCKFLSWIIQFTFYKLCNLNINWHFTFYFRAKRLEV